MERITVNNLSIQFDTNNSTDEKKNIVYSMLDSINEVLRREFPEETPQILCESIDNSDINTDNDTYLVDELNQDKNGKIRFIKRFVEENGSLNLTAFDKPEYFDAIVLNEVSDDHQVLIECITADGVETTEYINGIEQDTSYIDFDDLPDDIFDEVYNMVEAYFDDMEKTMERCKD